MEHVGITAIILAAGYSERMGRFKPLLDLGGRPVIARVVDTFVRAGIRDVRVVAGYNKDILMPVLHKLGTRVIVNDNYADGMFTSVLAAVKGLESGVKAFFLLPADIPLVRPWTIRYLAENFVRNEGKILVPCFMGQHGHPPLIASRFIENIMNYRGEDGLSGVLKQQEADTVSIRVPDRNILFDVDKPGDYMELQQRWKGCCIPSVNECEVMLKEVHKVPDWTLQHSRTVAGIAGRITDELNRYGSCLDRDLILAASLLHDIAKGKPGHAGESARIVRDFGCPEVAHIIESHTDIVLSPYKTIGAAEVLYLADKLVSDDKLVTLSERFGESVARHGNKPGTMRKIETRYKNALTIKDCIEARIGTMPLDLQYDGNKLAGTQRWV